MAFIFLIGGIFETVCFFFTLLLIAPSYASTHLATSPYWLQLGHYKKTTFGHWKSEIDSADFFLAQEGLTNPEAELKATLNIFNHPQHSAYQETICRFPARFHWLKVKLNKPWPQVTCPEMQKWQKALDPDSLTLVFPTAFMNSPSSMFGHTLLRVNAKDQTRHKDLVAFAVNFAAQPDTKDGALTFAYKGLVGDYPGQFSVMPYYKKVVEYSDIESRDIWEYELNLTPIEIERVLLHLWELQHAKFDYFFIDENCSYQLLALLQLANETLDLTQHFSVHAIPSDTVKVLFDHQLLQAPKYRPAFGTKLMHYANQVSPALLLKAQKVMDNEMNTLDDLTIEDQAKVLELAYEWLNFNFLDLGLERDKTAKQLQSILLKRSRLKTPSTLATPPQPIETPEKSHDSTRIGMGAKYQEHDVAATFAWRMTYHDLLDNPQGFIPGAQINFLETEFTVDDHGDSKLDSLYLLDAWTLPTVNAVFDPWSWFMQIGFDRPTQQGHAFIRGGYGKTWGQHNRLAAYLLLAPGIHRYTEEAPIHTVSLGLESGLLWTLNGGHKLSFTQSIAKHNRAHNVTSQFALNFNYLLSENHAVRAEMGVNRWQQTHSYASLKYYYYF